MHYVLIFAKPAIGDFSQILVVLKDRPAWQRGKVNIIGGKIEKDESPQDAAVRELKEESGLDALTPMRLMGKIEGTWGTVHCFMTSVNQQEDLKPQDGESECVFWTKWDNLRNHELLMPNLRVIIPLMKEGVVGWRIIDEGPSWTSDHHSFSIIVPSHNANLGEPCERGQS